MQQSFPHKEVEQQHWGKICFSCFQAFLYTQFSYSSFVVEKVKFHLLGWNPDIANNLYFE